MSPAVKASPIHIDGSASSEERSLNFTDYCPALTFFRDQFVATLNEFVSIVKTQKLIKQNPVDELVLKKKVEELQKNQQDFHHVSYTRNTEAIRKIDSEYNKNPFLTTRLQEQEAIIKRITALQAKINALENDKPFPREETFDFKCILGTPSGRFKFDKVPFVGYKEDLGFSVPKTVYSYESPLFDVEYTIDPKKIKQAVHDFNPSDSQSSELRNKNGFLLRMKGRTPKFPGLDSMISLCESRHCRGKVIFFIHPSIQNATLISTLRNELEEQRRNLTQKREEVQVSAQPLDLSEKVRRAVALTQDEIIKLQTIRRFQDEFNRIMHEQKMSCYIANGVQVNKVLPSLEQVIAGCKRIVEGFFRIKDEGMITFLQELATPPVQREKLDVSTLFNDSFNCAQQLAYQFPSLYAPFASLVQ